MCFPDADSSKFWLSFVSSSDTSASFKDESELKKDGALRMRWVLVSLQHSGGMGRARGTGTRSREA